MTRGRKPTAARDEAKRFAERMKYRWLENTDSDLPYDLLIYKEDSIRAVKVLQTRSPIRPETFYEKEFPDEVSGLRSLPFPPFVIRELWLKTRGERVYRRLHVTGFSVGEIEWYGPDGYTNPHARREVPEKRGPTGKFIVRKSASPKLIIPPEGDPGSVPEK